ncbi:MAG: DUF115 domain-containing protein [Nitrospirota bacterium]|nr:DUF115 domain-containing protein [Nitrospirota bacterium]
MKNLAALDKYHPELVEMIAPLAIDENRMKILSSESGNPRIVYKKEDGEEINIHSAEDPAACANQAVDLLGKIEKEGIIVLFGFGLGYFAEEIFKKFEKGHLLLIYEVMPEMFKLALKVRDLSILLNSDRVKIVLGENADNYSVIHLYHQHIINGKFWVIEHKPSVKLNPDRYENFFRRLKEEKNLVETGISTVIGRGKEFMDAFFTNIPSIMRRPGVLGLKDAFKGCKAIVVSAGPSLDKNVHLLKKLKGKAVIIATGGALPTLLSSDIFPDMVVEIDPASENIEDKFQDIPVLKHVPFISLVQYTPELLKLYPGPLFMNSALGNIAFLWMDNTWEDKGNIECFGGSVAHLAFATAEYIGADVIALVGQDLSFTGDRAHTVGYSDDLDRRLKAGIEKGQRNIAGSMIVKDIFDEEVFTLNQFITFKTSFENRIRQFGRTIINATENGLLIEGAVNMRLADFIDEYCSDSQEVDIFSVLSDMENSEIKYDMDLIFKKLRVARKKYDEIKTASRKILSHIKRVKSLKENNQKDSPELNNVLKKIQRLSENIKNPLLDILAGYHYELELYLKKQEVLDIDEIEDEWELLDKQLERGLYYYNGLINAINPLNKQLDKTIAALKIEKEVDSVMSDMSIDEKERYYRAGMIYRKSDIPAQAVKYLEASLNIQGAEDRHRDILISLAEMYMKQFRYYDVREILEKIESQNTEFGNDKSHITELLRTCNKKINKWETRKRTMSKILKEAEVNYGSHMESGYFYLRIKDFKRAEKAYLKAIEEMQEAGCRGQETLSSAYYGLAHTYLAQDDPEKAVDALEKAIEGEPGNPIFYRDLGFISVNNNNIASAELFFTKAIELSPQTPELYKLLADLYLNRDEREKAIGLYEKAMKVNPDDPVIQHELAMVLNETISAARS